MTFDIFGDIPTTTKESTMTEKKHDGIEITVGVLGDRVLLGVRTDDAADKDVYVVSPEHAIELASSIMDAAMEASGMGDIASLLRATLGLMRKPGRAEAS